MQVLLDHTYCGEHVVLVKGGTRVCGAGAAIANAPLMQNKSYWEIKLQTSGVWNIGVAARQANFNTLPLGDTTLEWCVRAGVRADLCACVRAWPCGRLAPTSLPYSHFTWTMRRVLRSDGGLYHNGKKVAALPDTMVIEEGDVIVKTPVPPTLPHLAPATLPQMHTHRCHCILRLLGEAIF